MNVKNLYPMRLSALPMERLWGGDKLGKFYNKNCESGTGETWELSVREKEKSVVSNGMLAGKTLYDVVDADKSLVGERFAGGEFPLLIKFIDAADDLSVQVHPDDEYAAKVENDVGKTEMWHIVEAEPGAKLVYGLADGVTVEDFARAVREGKTQAALKYVEVHAGETYFIPAGLVHAIGGGILLAEVQQNCDLTYRVYDFDRLDKNGKPRELHTEKAIECVKCFTDAEIDAVRYARGRGDAETLADCPYFKVSRLEVNGTRDVEATKESFVSLLCVNGRGKLIFDGAEYEICRGDSYFLPAGLGISTFEGEMTVILSQI